ncbi:GPI inositol-deacylase [Venturia nashicola]|nr:GPI inositol-deacylase [Venturia nashicola]
MAGERGVRKRQRVSHDDDDGKKTRGRPRVEGADETAADRRRTQIRLAQRAYRLRKETTISSLQVQVSALQTTIEEMNKTFLNFNDRAVASGVLQMSPDLGRELKAATEQFILLAKASHQSGDEHSDSEMEEEPHDSSKTSPHDIETEHQISFSHAASSHSPEPPPSVVDIGMGYSMTYGDSMSAQSPASMYVSSRDFNSATEMQTATTTGRYHDTSSSFGLFQYSTPATSGVMLAVAAPSDPQYQQYNVQVPSPTQINVPSMAKTMPGDYTYSFQETTFARRLQRATLERGFHLLSNAEERPHAYSRVFRLSLMYHSRDNLIARFRAALSKDPGHAIETYQTPFIHLGGAGMHYNTGRVHNGYIVKPGPLQRQITLESVDGTGMPQEVMDFDLAEYEGQWFDSNDVEGYLESKGLHIDPQSTFVEWQTDDDVLDIFSSPSPSASGVETVATTASPSPSTPRHAQDSDSWNEIGVWDSNASWDTAATGWLMGSGDKTPDFLNSGWSSVKNPASWDFSDTVGPHSDDYNASHLANAVAPEPKTKKNVTIDVSKLIDEIIKTGICLGRAPGFRKRDLDRALNSSIIQIF